MPIANCIIPQPIFQRKSKKSAILPPMSSFTCQHLNVSDDQCLLLKTDCVPGRKGCVLAGQTTFLVPAEERIRLREAEKRHKPPHKKA